MKCVTMDGPQNATTWDEGDEGPVDSTSSLIFKD